jgi:hypothetical protein
LLSRSEAGLFIACRAHCVLLWISSVPATTPYVA